MERKAREPPRRGNEHMSFSSTLLDVIYRSIDESDAGGTLDNSFAPQKRSTLKERVVIDKAVSRHWGLHPIATSSSSDNSSFGGFSSSSELDSSASHRYRIRPIRSASGASTRSAATASVFRPPPPPPPRPSQRAPFPPEENQRQKKKPSSIRSKIRDLGRSRAPASPGARLASLFNSLFATAGGKPRKAKSPPLASTGHDSAFSSASSRSRPCLVKTPSAGRGIPSVDEGLKRSVRFHPVSVIVGEDLRPCGKKIITTGDRTAAAVREEVRRRAIAAAAATMAEAKGREAGRRSRIEDILRKLEDEEDEEEKMSDSSSDLFELENLTVTGCGGGYRDELPVYETTHPGKHRILSRGSLK